MKISDILNIVDTKNISSKDLRKMTQKLQDAANKRVKRMMEDPIGRLSLVAERAEEKIRRGQSGYFTMKGVSSRAELRNRFRQLQKFLGPDRPGSSLKAFKKQYRRITRELGGAPTSDFWKAYRELAREYPDGNFPGGYDSYEVQRLMMSYAEESSNWDEILQKAKDFLTKAYEERESADYDEFFDVVDDEEDLPF